MGQQKEQMRVQLEAQVSLADAQKAEFEKLRRADVARFEDEAADLNGIIAQQEEELRGCRSEIRALQDKLDKQMAEARDLQALSVEKHNKAILELQGELKIALKDAAQHEALVVARGVSEDANVAAGKWLATRDQERR